MVLAKLTLALRKLLRRRNGQALAGLRAPEQMRHLLAQERMRTDRTGESFSLITFTPHSEAMREATMASLVKILKVRLRMTDEVGFLGPCQLGAVLPMTTGSGAWKVAEDIVARFSLEIPPPRCQVYSYLGDLESGDRGQGSGSSQKSGGKEQERVKSAVQVSAACPIADSLSAGPTVPGVSQPVQAMVEVLANSLPFWKHSLDVVVSLLALVLLAPIFLLTALAIKVFSPGPVLFAQWRTGLGGKPFRIYKFRTMTTDAEARKKELRSLNEQDGPAFKIKNDPRTTMLGRFLRRTSLDELPQLWNVLKGDMSLVGPRPLPCEEMAACSAWHQQRLEVTPGLTCIWQVFGRGTVSFAEWVRMDVQYIRSRSLLQDLYLLCMTVPAVLLRRGLLAR